MTNEQFTVYIENNVKAIKEELNAPGLSVTGHIVLKRQLEMLQEAQRIMTYGTGTARRRFRREYERNLAKQGVNLED